MPDEQGNPSQEEREKAQAELKADELVRLARIEGKLGVPHGYYQSMLEQGSDWEFAIKLVVLLEAALGTVIAAKLQHEAMRDHCDRLSLVGRSGKLDLAVGLGVLKPEEAKAFAVLAEVRNRFAHRVENINSNLEAFARALPKGDLPNYLCTVMMVPKEDQKEVEFLWQTEHAATLFRYTLWMGGSMVLDALATQDANAEAEAARKSSWRSGPKHKWTLRDLYAIGLEEAQMPQALEALNAPEKK